MSETEYTEVVCGNASAVLKDGEFMSAAEIVGELRVACRWTLCSSVLPPETVPVLGYNPDWVDGDFNPKGVRECVLYGDGTQWMTARWCDAHDCWITTYDHEAIPTHWMEYPKPPGGKNE